MKTKFRDWTAAYDFLLERELRSIERLSEALPNQLWKCSLIQIVVAAVLERIEHRETTFELVRLLMGNLRREVRVHGWTEENFRSLRKIEDIIKRLPISEEREELLYNAMRLVGPEPPFSLDELRGDK